MKRSAVLSAAVLALAGCAPHDPPPVSPKVQAAYEKGVTVAPRTTPPLVKFDASRMAKGTKVAFWGDSWTGGAGANKPTDGYAYVASDRMEWDSRVIGVGGTGYLNPGVEKIGTYEQRAAKLDVDPTVRLLVVQGSINDQIMDLAGHYGAVESTLEMLRVKFPSAQIVLLGPVPSTIPANPNLTVIDGNLFDVAAEQKLPYISPIAEGWLTADNYAEMINEKAANHPSTEGHAYLAGKVIDALTARS